MMKFIVNLVEIIVIGKVVYEFGKRMLFGRFISKGKKRRTSLIGKTCQLCITNPLHHKMDKLLDAQKEKFTSSRPQQTSQKQKAVEFRVYRKVN